MELAKNEAADIVNLKISKTGELLLAKKIETLAESFDLPCVVGTEIETRISSVAKMHLAASMNNLSYSCEFTERFYLEETVLATRTQIEKGYVELPKGDGFGAQIDEKTLSRHVVKF